MEGTGKIAVRTDGERELADDIRRIRRPLDGQNASRAGKGQELLFAQRDPRRRRELDGARMLDRKDQLERLADAD